MQKRIKQQRKQLAENSSLSSYYTGEAKGYVYGVDELHVVGLPTDERGYTKAGDYGEIK